MVGAGIFDGATLIVGGVIKLLPENPLNAPIVLEEGQELVIFGVVTYVINEAK